MLSEDQILAEDAEQFVEPVDHDFGFTRRTFVQMLGAGLLICASAGDTLAQTEPSGRARFSGRDRGAQSTPLSARLHIAPDGTITVLSGKVEGGQGARTEIA